MNPFKTIFITAALGINFCISTLNPSVLDKNDNQHIKHSAIIETWKEEQPDSNDKKGEGLRFIKAIYFGIGAASGILASYFYATLSKHRKNNFEKNEGESYYRSANPARQEKTSLYLIVGCCTDRLEGTLPRIKDFLSKQKFGIPSGLTRDPKTFRSEYTLYQDNGNLFCTKDNSRHNIDFTKNNYHLCLICVSSGDRKDISSGLSEKVSKEGFLFEEDGFDKVKIETKNIDVTSDDGKTMQLLSIASGEEVKECLSKFIKKEF